MNKWWNFGILQTYRTVDILKSALLGFLVYLLYGALVLTPTIVISLLYVPYMLYFFMGMYIMLSLVASRSVRLFTETLQNYQQSELDFETFIRFTTVILAIVTFIVLAIVYVNYIA